MAVIKCKMCGGNLDITEGSTVCECEYCGTRQTVPTADNEKKLTLFARAGRLLRACEFDKAAGVFESIVSEFPEEAEAYWGLVLCRFGIEYVDDPATGKKVPTCHRSGFDSVMHDSDFEQACENADPIARRQYREEAKQIEELRKAIIEVSGREAPYDIFICYKETDPNGGRTMDSVLAQDVYDALTAKGYRVFFSRITLEDKLGVEYEPYIFAALNSAKVMLVFGTDYEHFNAVWVKNEWSRFLKLMAKDKSRHLIPCFRGIDAYDMPEEFARLQSQDMGKVGAVQDLLRGVEKLLPKKNDAPKEAPAAPVFAGGPNVTALLDRGNMALEDAEFDKARDFFDQVLNMDSRSADAYLGLAMADMKSRSRDELFKTGTKPGSNLGDNRNMKRALQFGGAELKAWYDTVKKTKEENKAKAAEEKRIAREKAEEEARLAREREELERRQREERYRLERERFAAVMRSTRQRITQADGMISASHSYTAAVRSDGTILLTGKVFNGSSDAVTWQGIKAISSGTNHLVGIRTDGTVTAVGSNVYHECEVSD